MSKQLSNYQDILKIMLDTHVEFLPKYPPTHEDSELYMYMAKRISAKVEPLNNDEWISVKNDLPDYDVYVLWIDKEGHCFVEALDKDGNDWLYDHEIEGFKMFGATHWQPLPKSPKIN